VVRVASLSWADETAGEIADCSIIAAEKQLAMQAAGSADQ